MKKPSKNYRRWKMSNYWWLVEGVIVEDMTGETLVRLRHDTVRWTTSKLADGVIIIPRGVPFDCMPEWATHIDFKESYEGLSYLTFYNDDGNYMDIDFPKCPENWKGKTFPITDELRRLIG
jgi:hypothetical protein